MAGVTQQRCAASVTSLRSQCRPRWVSYPVLFRLRPGGNPPLRPQPHGFIELFSHEIFHFLVARVFAKYITLRKYSKNDHNTVYSSFFDLSIWHFRNAFLRKAKRKSVVPQRFPALFAK